VKEMIEGIDHFISMKRYYDEFKERCMTLIGQRTGQVFRIGEKIKVKLVNVDVEQYDIDFELVEDAGNNKKKNGQEKTDSKKKKPKDHKKSRNVDFEIRGRNKQKRSKKGKRKRKRRKK